MAYTNTEKAAKQQSLHDKLVAIAIEAENFVAGSGEAEADPMPADIKKVRDIGRNAQESVGYLALQIARNSE